MPPRNLTAASPHIGGSDSASSEENVTFHDNPFNTELESSHNYEGQSYDDTTSSGENSGNLNSSTNRLLQGSSSSPEIKQHQLGYSNSFRNSSTSSSLLNPFSSSNKLNSIYNEAKANDLDRYPKRYSSKMESSNSINSHRISTSNKSQLDSDGYLSDAESNPFIVDTDFSPFGGYPASSFPLLIDEKEDDDYLHNPDPIEEANYNKHRLWNDLKSMDKRSTSTFIGLLLLGIGFLCLFVLSPAITYTHVNNHRNAISASARLRGSNGESSKQGIVLLTNWVYPKLSAIRTELVDPDTPKEYFTRKARDGSDWKLVFSDEFAVEGRTFYEGDEQFWYAPNFHYDATKDLEWYDPDAVTTKNGTLRMRMDAFKNHNLFYRSGMLHSWNRMCFTQGVMEVSIKLPMYGNITGLWPGAWSMGNLGRPGYMATTDGVWPYSYDSCDAGITPNQSSPDGINLLPGQRLSSCTCKGEDHPNIGVGRGAPEIDIIEAEVDTNIRCGVASQSMQIAPMDIWYIPDYNWIVIHNASVTTINTYAGGPFQQAVSGVTTLNTDWYQRGVGERFFQSYSFEYLNDDSTGYLTWFVGQNPTLTVHANALAPNGNIGWRRISKEPMSMILNLGISKNWAYIDFPSIEFPVEMEVDYVRIYQPEDQINLTCDPPDYPTVDYIEKHPLAYQNWNNTLWKHTGYSWPKNKLTGNC